MVVSRIEPSGAVRRTRTFVMSSPNADSAVYASDAAGVKTGARLIRGLTCVASDRVGASVQDTAAAALAATTTRRTKRRMGSEGEKGNVAAQILSSFDNHCGG